MNDTVETPGDLRVDTRVERGAPGDYHGTLTPHWSFRRPSGGALLTVSLRAMTEELADEGLRPRSATTIFCAPVEEGPFRVRVTRLRTGRATAQLRAELFGGQEQAVACETIATFSRDKDGMDLIDTAPPVVPKPSESLPEAHTQRKHDWVPPIFRNIESRLALGHLWWTDGWEPGEAKIARWMRYVVPPMLADGRMDPLAIGPVADTMPPALTQKLGPGYPAFRAPSLDLTVHFLEDTRREWLLTVARARRARAGYATAEIEIWDDENRLLAIATQTMMIRKTDMG